MGPEAVHAALVREVSPGLAQGEVTFLQRTPVDLERARSQHRAYVEVLRGYGLEIVQAPPLPEHPDGVFVEDAVVVVDHLAVLTRSGAPSRRGEAASLQVVLEAYGLEVVGLSSPATLDGGDVLQVGATILVGRTTRTNDAGIEQLRAFVTPLGRHVVPVEVDGALHLKTGATALPDGRILANLDAVSPGAFEGRQVVPAEEAEGANALCIAGSVVLAASAPRTATTLRDEGFDVATVDISELEKVEAGPTCPSVLLPGRSRPGG